MKKGIGKIPVPFFCVNINKSIENQKHYCENQYEILIKYSAS